MTAMPDRLEVCARIQYGLVCGGLIYRPEPGKASCWKCGSDAEGVFYVPKRIATPPPHDRVEDAIAYGLCPGEHPPAALCTTCDAVADELVKVRAEGLRAGLEQAAGIADLHIERSRSGVVDTGTMWRSQAAESIYGAIRAAIQAMQPTTEATR
jgi:hypothetical protein